MWTCRAPESEARLCQDLEREGHCPFAARLGVSCGEPPACFSKGLGHPKTPGSLTKCRNAHPEVRLGCSWLTTDMLCGLGQDEFPLWAAPSQSASEQRHWEALVE